MIKKEKLEEIVFYYTKENKIIPIGFSSCLIGTKCGWDGNEYTANLAENVYNSKKIKPVHFCPENFIYGTPREFSSIHGGTGDDVLDGNAKVLTVDGKDWTDGSIKSAYETLRIFKENKVVIAIMTEISPTCSPDVIYSGDPTKKNYIKGLGVTAALLKRNGIELIAQRDEKTLNYLLFLLDNSFIQAKNALDFIEIEWYKDYFKT
ncbi:MAG: DUF523 domain-containing protein [Candidatus Sericytochromatia bacterium]